MTIDWAAVATGAITFTVALILKTLLDFRLAHFIVKHFWWLPVRDVFRDRPTRLAGQWDVLWGSGGSASFQNQLDRHGHSRLRQLGGYCYAEFFFKGIKYAFFGEIRGEYLVGDWFDVRDRAGYYGAFQLKILSSSSMAGLWVGHSKQANEIRSDTFEWRRLEG